MGLSLSIQYISIFLISVFSMVTVLNYFLFRECTCLFSAIGKWQSPGWAAGGGVLRLHRLCRQVHLHAYFQRHQLPRASEPLVVLWCELGYFLAVPIAGLRLSFLESVKSLTVVRLLPSIQVFVLFVFILILNAIDIECICTQGVTPSLPEVVGLNW